MVDSAAYVALNMGGTRSERSVVLFCNALNSLIPILEDPSNVLEMERQGHFQYDPIVSRTDQMPWGPIAPVTAVIQSGSLHEESLRLGIALAGIGMPQSMLQAVDVRTLRDHFYGSQFLDDGGFLVEYAIGTSTMFIRYFEPMTSGGPAYDDNLTPITTNWIASSGVGFVHFDLSVPSILTPRDRAEYIFSYIQNPVWLQNKMNAQTVKTHIEPHITNRGGLVQMSSVDTTASHRFRSKAQRFGDQFPTVVVEKLSCGGGPTEPCTMMTIKQYGEDDDGTQVYEFGDMLVKNY